MSTDGEPDDLASVIESVGLQHDALRYYPLFATQLEGVEAASRDKALYLAGVVAAHALLNDYQPISAIPFFAPPHPEMSE